MKKRWLAMLMAAIMCLSLLPMSALATESSPPEPPDDSGSSTETVNKTITVDDSFTDGKLVEGSTYATIQAAIDYIAGLDVTKDPEARDDWTIHVKNGEYERFTVPHFNSSHIANLTIVGESEEGVKVNVLTSDTITKNDNGGINIYGQDVVLRNMTITAGNINGDKYAAISTHHGDVGGRNVSLTVDNCTLIGPGIGTGATYGIFWACDRVEVTNCNISGFANAIEFMNDGFNVPEGETYHITNNTITGASFAFHGYMGGGNGGGVLDISNNTITGTETLRSKVIAQDSTTDSFVVDIKDNILTHTIVGLVNLRDEGDVCSDVLANNTFNDGCFYVEAIEPGTIEFYTTYQAPNNDEGYWKLTGIDDIESNNPDNTLSHVQQAINEANAKGSHTLSITGIDKENLIKTFTWFKDAIYWVSGTPDGSETTDKWDEEHSKSKSATNLDKNYESQVTLSLPSAEEQLVTDVVFVLDKSTSADVVTEAQNMLESLEDDVAKTGATVKVGVVIFNKEDHRVLELTELNDGNLPTINSAIANEQKIQSGTNAHAGLQEGKAMLDEDTSVDASRKYLIFVSDGITYLFDDENDKSTSIVTMQCEGRGNGAIQTPYMNYTGAALKYPYETNIFDETTITGYLDNVGKLMETDGRMYWVEYESTVTETTPALKSNKNDSGKVIIGDDAFNDIVGSDNVNDHANNLDTALYLTNQVYQSAVSEGYHCYAVRKNDSQNSNYPWANQFMDYLANGEAVSFDGIQNDIFYLLSAGSKVKDYMGYVKDDYNFDFVNDASKLTIKVGDKEYKAEKIDENQYGFNKRVAPISESSSEAVTNTDYDYVLTYVPGNKQDTEHFVWDISVPVTNFAPVSLTYTVKLTNPQTSAGTYGQYDEYGTLDYPGLYTNNRATLSPVDSNGNVGELEWFAKPTVSYTVKSSGGGGGGGGSSKPPVLNTEDHFGYIIGYPEHYLTGEACHDQTLMPVKPEGNITRAEVATIFFRMLTDDSRNEFWSQTSSYSDVELDDWFNNAICTLSNAGVINGYEDGTFKPNGKITRAEFATIASRFFEYADENMENPFSDVEENTWYYQYIMAASDMGLINGYPDGTFKPDDLITRAEAVTIVNRTLDRHPDQENFLEDMLVWPDNMDTEKWYYADMQEATNSHEYQMKAKNGEKYEVWTKMLPIRDWEAFEKAWSDANSSNNPGEVVK